MNDSKIINDPVFGFIKIPRGLLLNIVQHPLMQRLTRIKQLGMANVVYPGAQHTRFLHSIGAFHLMSEAVLSLEQKGVFIFDSEAEAVEAAILMHDIGHAPFSHVLEGTLIHGISHEEISVMMMQRINDDMKGELNLAIKIFKDQYPKKFLHQLISSQLDVDRLDYLRRDSFFTGVTEGNIGSARIIKMLNVVDDSLVVESKAIYSIENYLTSRRLMYWSVYLHKTVVAYEKTLFSTSGQSPSRCAVADSCAISLDRRMTAGETWESCLQEIRDLPAVKKWGDDVTVTMYKYERPSYTNLVYPTECYFPTWVLPEDHVVCESLVEAYKGLFDKDPVVDKWTISNSLPSRFSESAS